MDMDHVVTNQKKPEVKSQPTQQPKITQAVDIVQIVRGGKKVLQELMSKVPSSLFSIDKEIFIGNEIIKTLTNDYRLALRSLINGFLEDMRRRSASDIDLGGLGSNKQVWFRVQGDKKPFSDLGSYETTEFDILIQSILLDSQREELYQRRNVDFSYTFSSSQKQIYRNRANVAFDLNSLSLNMRAIETRTRKFESYGFHPHVAKNLHLKYTQEGLILVTGITGSGKSTTLDAIVDLNNQTMQAHIIIISAPIEFVHTPQ